MKQKLILSFGRPCKKQKGYNRVITKARIKVRSCLYSFVILFVCVFYYYYYFYFYYYNFFFFRYIDLNMFASDNFPMTELIPFIEDGELDQTLLSSNKVCLVYEWPGQTDSQLDTRTCVQTCDGWPNGFVSRIASRKSRKFPVYIQMTCDQLVSNCFCFFSGWPNGEKLDMRVNLSST